MNDNCVLVGDVGGTNVRFAVASQSEAGISVSNFAKMANDDYSSFYEALESFLDRVGEPIQAACFAIAGPVENGAIEMTNRSWRISESELRDRFAMRSAILINDFTGMARSVPELSEESFLSIRCGEAVKTAPVLVTGAGTGLGVAVLLPDASGWRVIPGQGGHMAFAPETEIEIELLKALRKRIEYVSNEVVASGSGLDSVHDAFCEMYGRDKLVLSPEKMHQLAKSGDEMFDALIKVRAHTVMRAAGDLVLAVGAHGGVVLAGGVTERIVEYIRAPDALERFYRRGPMAGYLENCPIKLMSEPKAPLIGAAAYYLQQTGL